MTPDRERAIREAFPNFQAEVLLAALGDGRDGASGEAFCPDRLMKVPDAAAALGCSRSTIYSMMASGRLRSIHLGRLVRIPSSAITEVAEGR